MKKLMLLAAVLLFVFSVGVSMAAPLPTVMTYSTTGLNVSIDWNSVPGASGYILNYAPKPYTGPDSIGTVDVGSQTSFDHYLWEGASYFIAVQSYDSQGASGYSNVESFTVSTSTRLFGSSTYSNEFGPQYCSEGTHTQDLWDAYTSAGETFSTSGCNIPNTGTCDYGNYKFYWAPLDPVVDANHSTLCTQNGGLWTPASGGQNNSGGYSGGSFGDFSNPDVWLLSEGSEQLFLIFGETGNARLCLNSVDRLQSQRVSDGSYTRSQISLTSYEACSESNWEVSEWSESSLIIGSGSSFTPVSVADIPQWCTEGVATVPMPIPSYRVCSSITQTCENQWPSEPETCGLVCYGDIDSECGAWPTNEANSGLCEEIPMGSGCMSMQSCANDSSYYYQAGDGKRFYWTIDNVQSVADQSIAYACR